MEAFEWQAKEGKKKHLIQQTNIGKHRPFGVNLHFNLYFLFASLIIQWCYDKDWPYHHHPIGVKLCFKSHYLSKTLKLSHFYRTKEESMMTVICWIFFLLLEGSRRHRTGIHSCREQACNPVGLLGIFEEDPGPIHTSPLYQIYPPSVRDPTDPASAVSQTEGSNSIKSGEGMLPGQPQGHESPL